MRKILGAFAAVMLCSVGMVAPPPAGADGDGTGGWVRSAWTIDQAAYTAQASGDIVRFSAELTIKILQDGYQEIPLAFDSAVITDVKTSGAGVTLIARDDQYALAVQKKGTCKVKVLFSAPLTRDDRYEQVYVGIPQAVFSRLTLEIPRTDVELAPDQALTVEKEVRKESVVLACALGLSRQIHLRWAARPVQQDPVEPSFLTDLRVLTNLDEESLRMVALIRTQVLQGEIKSVAFDLPAGLSVLSVRSAEIEDWKTAPSDGGQRVTVSFREPLKIGTTQLIVEAEQSLSRPAGQVIFPSIVPLESKRVTGYLAVATGTSMELEDPAMEGLRRLDVREIPEDLRSLATAPIVAAFRYQQAPYKLSAGLRQPEHLAVLVAIAESGDLATVVTPTGEAITRAVYQIRNNKKASLAVTLPEGATLWSVLVDQRSVKPAAGPKGQILVPLAVGSGPERSFPVEIVYVEKSSPFEWVGGKEYQGPGLDVPMTAVRWNLFMPEEVRGYWFAGNLQRHLRVAGFLPEPAVMGEAVLARRVALQKRAADGSRREDNISFDASGSAPAAEEMKEFRKAIAGVQQSGILPFRIAIPTSGRSHLFSRLLTTADPLTIRVRYVKVAPQVFPLSAGAVGLAVFLLLFRSGILPGLRRRSAVEAPASN